MSSPLTLQISDVQKTLAELNKFDKVYRREITKRIKGAGTEIITTARQLVGNVPPLSGMARGKLIKGREVYWDNKSVKAGFKIKVGRRGSRGGTVQFKDNFDVMSLTFLKDLVWNHYLIYLLHYLCLY